VTRVARWERALDARPVLRWSLVVAAGLLQTGLLVAEALARHHHILHVVLAAR
jgi:cytochrome c oxidase subunit IV